MRTVRTEYPIDFIYKLPYILSPRCPQWRLCSLLSIHLLYRLPADGYGPGALLIVQADALLPAVIFVSGQPAPVVHFETQLGLGRQESRQIVEKLLKIMKDTLSQGDDLLISGFGKFSVRQKKARQGRNPQTKESIILSARKVLVFKPSGVLRKRINEGLQMPE